MSCHVTTLIADSCQMYELFSNLSIENNQNLWQFSVILVWYLMSCSYLMESRKRDFFPIMLLVLDSSIAMKKRIC